MDFEQWLQTDEGIAWIREQQQIQATFGAPTPEEEHLLDMLEQEEIGYDESRNPWAY